MTAVDKYKYYLTKVRGAVPHTRHMQSKTCENSKCGEKFFKRENQSKIMWNKRKFCTPKCSRVSNGFGKFQF